MIEDIDYGVLGPRKQKTIAFFFVIGVIAALGLRLVLILNHYNKLWSILAWYISMFCYLIFYFHRLKIERKRRELIKKEDLINKIKNNNISDLDKESILKILNSLTISKLNLNFLILIIMTVLALIIEIILDFKSYF